MKSRITGKPAKKQTIEESLKEMIILEEQNELENKVLAKIVESGEKKKVSVEIYSEHFDPSECRYCMNFNFKTNTCKKNMPNIDPWYTKDNGLIDECIEWDYIYEIEK